MAISKHGADGQIVPGQEWAPEIIRRLDEADIILLLVTASFLGSDYIGRVELVRALERHRRGEAIVIPVILRPVDWQTAGLEGLQALPKDGKAVSTWSDQDTAFLDIAQQSREVKKFVVMSRASAGRRWGGVRTGPLVDRGQSVTIVPATGGPVAYSVCHHHDHPCRHRRRRSLRPGPSG